MLYELVFLYKKVSLYWKHPKSWVDPISHGYVIIHIQVCIVTHMYICVTWADLVSDQSNYWPFEGKCIKFNMPPKVTCILPSRTLILRARSSVASAGCNQILIWLAFLIAITLLLYPFLSHFTCMSIKGHHMIHFCLWKRTCILCVYVWYGANKS